MTVKTISISAGVINTLSEALLIAAGQLDEKALEPRKPFRKDPMYGVRAEHFRRLERELKRALQDGQRGPVCVGYEMGQDWHLWHVQKS